MSGEIIVFSGYAGAGKNSIINEILKKFKELEYIPSVTTRKMREGESSGNPYYFFDLDQFNEARINGKFIEAENIHGNWYGTIKDKYEESMNKGHKIIKDIDVNGAIRFKELFGDNVYLVFVKPSNDKDVIDRMVKRGDSKDDIEKRIERIEYEKSLEKFFDTTIINDNLEEAVKQAEKVVGERVHR
ncbi:guanylate kinase [Oceanobacillus timonensis]|uniref:guanylate kinase n=1 Tax=Oceanobacillus timonensis TaxID=1926285 RepID=UPI0009BA6F24|nr:hypothetical protein [Oceanobacillus timonensis]